MNKNDYLNRKVEHIDIKSFDSTPILKQYANMAFQAKNLARAADIYQKMLQDNDCSIILCLAGSLFSAGLKQVVFDLVKHNMVDVIVSTGAIMIDQDFFEALGFFHYQGSPLVDDDELMKNQIDRIYDTFIDEEQLKVCDMTVKEIADSLKPGSYSSREFIQIMGRYLEQNNKGDGSVVKIAFEKGLPVFIPAFADSSAGLGLVLHQQQRQGTGKVAIDSVQDFLELTQVKIRSRDTGLLIIGGGVPKNFTQDTPVAADILGHEVNMHKYAIQITVADERDGGLSGSTLKEAHSWGKVDSGNEEMVFCEATIALPLIASQGYHSNLWKKRKEKRYNDHFERK